MNPDFSAMTPPVLVVAGDRDDSPLTTRGPDWLTDAHTRSPGPGSLLTLTGGEHSLGGIPAYEAAETTDESPERVALLRRVSTAFLQDALGVDGAAWAAVRDELAGDGVPLGRLESRDPVA